MKLFAIASAAFALASAGITQAKRHKGNPATPAPTTPAPVEPVGPSFIFEFDPKLAGGVSGWIQVDYVNPSPTCTAAKVSAELDFSKVDQAAIKKADGNCTADVVTTYAWHIHVKWNSSELSQSFAQCGKANTGNHYDPLHACGPFSEHIGTSECTPRVASYACNPDAYAKDHRVCEKGDLSGKLGDFKLDKQSKVAGEWIDPHFPRVEELTPQWNIIVHAVCGKATPRVACALIQEIDEEEEEEDEDGEDDEDSQDSY
ncbi:hypothetical protein ATCC90586_000934 [Pythium insidiosum]|nr:hypothetical protein ATCC90586_000934 [Pythium insidiosum]